MHEKRACVYELVVVAVGGRGLHCLLISWDSYITELSLHIGVTPVIALPHYSLPQLFFSGLIWPLREFELQATTANLV